ncbi:hypothetical protein O6H91_18G044800 [Diphasiastrum complanatum]|uniref:Uncharacterized protein n=1 Tax=Diphasiastrum complanatum TaxID=34168 RepID=A0ACC2B0I9_DIPCM|nr:hypothetical protein O6H91_18G044800 [Diphasiastrum complanatum]
MRIESLLLGRASGRQQLPAGVFCKGMLVIMWIGNSGVGGSEAAAAADFCGVEQSRLVDDSSWHVLALVGFFVCSVCAFWAGSFANSQGLVLCRSGSKRLGSKSRRADSMYMKSCNGTYGSAGSALAVQSPHHPSTSVPYVKASMKLDKQQLNLSSDASMMEQLVPEITHHALSYLDFKSLCSMSMTNSVMRKAANDDSAWKALYHKDFTVEQSSIIPPHGWKAHYAVTKAVADVNKSFYKKFRAKSLRGMSRLWLRADYVKCIHPGGEILSGYETVIENWRLVFNWSQRYDFQLQDVRVRVYGDMAWVTLKEYVNASEEPLLATNCFEFHGGQWYIVHHHSSPQLEAPGADYGLFG